jgi:hypothetical protein
LEVKDMEKGIRCTFYPIDPPAPHKIIETELFASWEVDLSAISDNYTPDEITAEELFFIWAEKAIKHYPDGLIPIYWSVRGFPKGISEAMPFQYLEGSDFLTYFSYPIRVDTGKPLNFADLPIIDKYWNTSKADKGGFIQEFLKWKPSPFQSHFYLPSFLKQLKSYMPYL